MRRLLFTLPLSKYSPPSRGEERNDGWQGRFWIEFRKFEARGTILLEFLSTLLSLSLSLSHSVYVLFLFSDEEHSFREPSLDRLCFS